MRRYNDESLKELFFVKGLEVIEDMEQLFQFLCLIPKDFLPHSLILHIMVLRTVEIKDAEKSSKMNE